MRAGSAPVRSLRRHQSACCKPYKVKCGNEEIYIIKDKSRKSIPPGGLRKEFSYDILSLRTTINWVVTLLHWNFCSAVREYRIKTQKNSPYKARQLWWCSQWAHLSNKWYRLFVTTAQIHQDIRTDRQETEPVQALYQSSAAQAHFLVAEITLHNEEYRIRYRWSFAAHSHILHLLVRFLFFIIRRAQMSKLSAKSTI